MAKFLFIYHGGNFPKTPEDGKKMMDDWNSWVEDMGTNLVEPGNGVGMSKTVTSDGAVVDNGGSNPTTGYCALTADNMDEALKIAQAHPFISCMGGTIEIAEAMVH